MFKPKTVPVRGTRKFRGGGHYFRQVRTTNERRANQVVDDEPMPRAARFGTNIPNSWSDVDICRQRSWKAQSRGRKAWDRARQPKAWKR